MLQHQLVGALLVASLASASPYLRPRAQYVTTVGTNSYDFIIAGGGLAGLVLASRLSEDSNTTVLVIEAGDTGEQVQNRIDVPGNAYYNGLVGSSYDWVYKTAPQPNAGNRELSWPRGKVLGGSSAINGMYLVYPTEIEVNAWRDMIAPDDKDAAEAWSWEQFSAAMRKSETFTPPVDNVKTEDNVQFQTSSRGSSGPLQASYPGYGFSAIGDYMTTLNNVGIAPCPDAGNGKTWGGFVTTSAMNPKNWTRSYSRNAYIDPLPPRSNLIILVNATVTRVLTSKDSSGQLTATGVEYVTAANNAKASVNANKEVILSAGAIGSPQLLMLSGIGPSDVLQAAGVQVQYELPGVGQHLQDHLSLPVIWNSNYQTAGAIHASGTGDANTPEFLSYVNSATSYINLTTIFGDGAGSVISNMMSALDSSASSLAPTKDAEALAGYKAIYTTTVNQVLNTPVGAIEMILNLAAPGSIGVIVALQHPLSQGRLYINSSSVFDHPVIDPAYFTHEIDKTVFREALKYARQIGNTEPLKSLLGDETQPGPSVQSDQDWDNWYINQATTEFHPGGACAMLPKNQGGVVNAKLQVYGTKNLRVIDSSVYPISFSAHLMMPTYGLAEKAAELIRAQYNGGSSSPTGSGGNNGSGGGSNNNPPSGANRLYPSSSLLTRTITLLTTSFVFLFAL